MTRIFFVADLHGSAVCFRKFVNAARIYRADVLLVGGDIAAKTMTPVFSDGTEWTVAADGEMRTARNPEELARLEASLRDSAPSSRWRSTTFGGGSRGPGNGSPICRPACSSASATTI
ncbi:MAG: hypothetical protein LVQ64_01075 [Thermoplasmatales archaeon]|nr:hypothetical protein [Thermoplasmatales archaeon]